MIKIDTNKENERLHQLSNAFNQMAISCAKEYLSAYDEAQKEIEELKPKFASVSAYQNRISTLEALLREVLENKFKDEDGCCDICGAGVGKVNIGIECTDDCLFTRIQKELGEG